MRLGLVAFQGSPPGSGRERDACWHVQTLRQLLALVDQVRWGLAAGVWGQGGVMSQPEVPEAARDPKSPSCALTGRRAAAKAHTSSHRRSVWWAKEAFGVPVGCFQALHVAACMAALGTQEAPKLPVF